MKYQSLFSGEKSEKMFQSVAAESVTERAKRSHDISATILQTIMKVCIKKTSLKKNSLRFQPFLGAVNET